MQMYISYFLLILETIEIRTPRASNLEVGFGTFILYVWIGLSPQECHRHWWRTQEALIEARQLPKEEGEGPPYRRELPLYPWVGTP